MKWIRKLVFGIVIVLLLPLLVFNIYNFINIKVLKNDITSFFGYAVLEVISGSMEPTIQVGDMIIIDRNAEEYKSGDVVTYYDEKNSFITHRIKEIKKDKIITAGDYTKTEDDPITKDQIVGKYLFKINHAGKILKSFQNPLSMIMIFLVGLFACIFLSVDKDGKPILTSEEKELEEYRLYKELKAKFENFEKQEEKNNASKEVEIADSSLKEKELEEEKTLELEKEEINSLEQDEMFAQFIEEPEEEKTFELSKEEIKDNTTNELKEIKNEAVEIKKVYVTNDLYKKNYTKKARKNGSYHKSYQGKKNSEQTQKYSKNGNAKRKPTNQMKKNNGQNYNYYKNGNIKKKTSNQMKKK